MTPILISIVIPTYKRPLLLARCLLSISKQTIASSIFEIIIVSDGPDEISGDVAKQLLEGRFNYKFITLPKKQGPATARNGGWMHASGNLIAFTDDDCLPDKNWLSAILDAYDNEILIGYTGSIMVPIPDIPTDFARNTAHLQNAAFVTANCCVTKEALITIGGFDERYVLAWREDSDLEFKLISNDIPIKHVQSAMVVHPVRDVQWGVSLNEQHKGVFNALLYKKFPELYRSRIQPSPSWNYYLVTLSFVLCLIGLFTHEFNIVVPAIIMWILGTFYLIQKRLHGTSHSFNHVAEMILTSIAIPFLSIYWQLYGAIKYRVLFF